MSEKKYARVLPTSVQCAFCKEWVPEGRAVFGSLTCPAEVCVVAGELYHQARAATKAVLVETKAPVRPFFVVDSTIVLDKLPATLACDNQAIVRISTEGAATDFVVIVPALVRYGRKHKMGAETLKGIAEWMEQEGQLTKDPATGKLYNTARVRRCAIAQQALKGAGALAPSLERLCAILATENRALLSLD